MDPHQHAVSPAIAWTFVGLVAATLPLCLLWGVRFFLAWRQARYSLGSNSFPLVVTWVGYTLGHLAHLAYAVLWDACPDAPGTSNAEAGQFGCSNKLWIRLAVYIDLVAMATFVTNNFMTIVRVYFTSLTSASRRRLFYFCVAVGVNFFVSQALMDVATADADVYLASPLAQLYCNTVAPAIMLFTIFLYGAVDMGAIAITSWLLDFSPSFGRWRVSSPLMRIRTTSNATTHTQESSGGGGNARPLPSRSDLLEPMSLWSVSRKPHLRDLMAGGGGHSGDLKQQQHLQSTVSLAPAGAAAAAMVASSSVLASAQSAAHLPHLNTTATDLLALSPPASPVSPPSARRGLLPFPLWTTTSPPASPIPAASAPPTPTAAHPIAIRYGRGLWKLRLAMASSLVLHLVALVNTTIHPPPVIKNSADAALLKVISALHMYIMHELKHLVLLRRRLPNLEAGSFASSWSPSAEEARSLEVLKEDGGLAPAGPAGTDDAAAGTASTAPIVKARSKRKKRKKKRRAGDARDPERRERFVDSFVEREPARIAKTKPPSVQTGPVE
ncbi:hypothetical protein H9P43_000299 [Blastocladiella emersonii ATCC 22665]|nr:hypothetical protein H9P43_000299 [Blastocladiella emersonii ATCC 22665]